MKMNFKDEMHNINAAIQNAQNTKQPVDKLYKKQLKLLELAHDEFVQRAKESGYDIATNLEIAQTEIQQFSAMKQIAQKLGISHEKYDEMINQVRIRMFGEQGAQEYFGK